MTLLELNYDIYNKELLAIVIVLKEYLDDFIIVYLNDIIIYLNSKKEYKEYIKWVLSRLYKENILVIIKKYKFHTKKTDFVGFIIKLK